MVFYRHCAADAYAKTAHLVGGTARRARCAQVVARLSIQPQTNSTVGGS
jgi:hypothetical protein